MGFLDRVGLGGEQVDLTIAVEPPQVLPGGDVTVRYEVTGELDDKCSALIVALEGTAFHRKNETTIDHDGRPHPHTVSAPYSLHVEPRQFAPALGPGQEVFTLPTWAPPSSADCVSWQAYVRMMRGFGTDEQQRVDVLVRLGGERVPTERAPQPGETGVVIEGAAVSVRPGDAVTGHVAITLAEDARAKDLTVSLERRVVTLAGAREDMHLLPDGPLAVSEFAPSLGNTIADFMDVGVDEIGAWSPRATVELSIDRDFSAGSLERFPFSLVVPDSGPSTANTTGRVEWRVAARLDRKGLFVSDCDGAIPLFVY